MDWDLEISVTLFLYQTKGGHVFKSKKKWWSFRKQEKNEGSYLLFNPDMYNLIF